MEECDLWSSSVSWCVNCKITNLTYPYDGMLDLQPKNSVVLGENMNLFQTYPSLWNPKITNLSNSDLYLWELCVIREWTPSVLTWNNQCSMINGNWILMARWMQGSTYSLSQPTFIWNTSNLGNSTYGDNIVVTTLKRDGTTYNSRTWFSASLNVRVAKPSVGTTWGWTSYVSGAKDISNVSEVARGIVDEDKNKNFAWVGVSTWNLSSYTKEVSDTNSVKEIWKEWNKYNEASKGTSTNSVLTTTTSENIWDFQNYNWLSNAFILKNTRFVIGINTLNWLSWARTYIIEDANLVINADISYSDNIAFVVRWWNIEIDKSVKNVKGIFIAIPKGDVGGKIIWLNGKTTDVLTVDGSFYGNVENLIDKRTYMKQNSDWLLDVWTVVNFGSSVFRDPAPLTTTFISEYLEAIKIAK
jgi:hypothetical protein